jgi:hypothetical protein
VALPFQLSQPFFNGLSFGQQVLQVFFQPGDLFLAGLEAAPERGTKAPGIAAMTTFAARSVVPVMLAVSTAAWLAPMMGTVMLTVWSVLLFTTFATMVMAMMFFVLTHVYHLLSSS